MKDIADIIAGHAARNRELVALIEQKGGDLHVDRTVDLHFWAYDEASAKSLANALRECGLTDVIAKPSASGGNLWNVEGQVVRSVLRVVDPKFVEQFANVAVAHRADFDGWGTSL